MTISLSFLPQLPSPFFMQDPKNSKSRKRWYRRAIEATLSWKTLSKPIPIKTINPWKTLSKSAEINQAPTNSRKLRKCTSTRVSSSFSHVCLCAPISSYADVFPAAVAPPKRSFSYPRSRSTSSARQEIRAPSARVSGEGRRIFRGKSLTDDVLMRRFVVDEEAMMQVRRRNEMEIIRRRSGMRKRKIGPSPLSRMASAMHQ